MNSVNLLGRLGADPELKESNGKSYLRFSLAVDRHSKDGGTDWVDCVAFGKTAEFIAKYFHKGARLAISGEIRSNSYKKDGKNYYSQSVVVGAAFFCESKSSSNDSGQNSDAYFAPVDDDGLPFN